MAAWRWRPWIGTEMYAYGWGVQKTRRNTTVVTHNGGNGFFFTDFRRYVDEKVVIIAMSNQAVIPATQLAPRQLEALYFNDAPVAMPPTGVAVPTAQRDALAGIYTSPSGPVAVRATPEGLEAETPDPTMFGSLGGVTPAGGRFADVEKQTMAIVDAAAKGNFDPMIDASRLEDPARPPVMRANQTRFWKEWRDQFGEFERADLLGTGNVQGDPAVTVRLTFARGGPVLQYIWGPRRLAGFRAVPVTPVALTAESAREWAYYSYRLPQTVRLTFGSDGTLTINGPAGTVIAKRQ